MKRKILILTTLIALAFTFSAVSFAQFGDLINKAKEAAKKKDKKTDTNQNETTKTESSAGGVKRTETEQPPAQNQLGLFYFSNQPFTESGEPIGAKNSFSSNESVFGRFVLKSGTIRSVLKPVLDPKTKKTMIDFKLYRIAEGNGRSYIDDIGRIYKAVIEESDLDKTYWNFDVFPSPENAKSMFYWGGNSNDGLTYAFDLYIFLNNPQTKEGTYQIRSQIAVKELDFRGNPVSSEPTKIEGSFNFSFRGSDFASIKSNYDNLEKNFAGNYSKNKAANEPLPSEWSAKSSPIISGFTVSSISNLYVNSFSDSAPNALKIIKFYAAPSKSQGTWIIQNNNYGIPNYRYSNQYYTVFIRDTRNGVCYYQGFGLRQEYTGGGTFGKTRIDHGDSALITCDKMGLK